MTKVSPELGYEGQMPVSADVSFASDHFPEYKLGPDNQVLEEVKVNTEGPSLKEVVVQETSLLSEQHKRLSVRDLASKFDKNLTAASKLSNETKLRDVVSLDGHVLLKKLRDALEYLKGQMTGENKEDMEKAISMVEALAVKLTQKEGELIQEKYEVKKLASYLKQASEDAKKLVNQERSFACAEIESARAVVQRIGEALDEQERISQTSEKQELMEEVQQARRIRLLHQPSKVMDMELELRALRLQIQEKYTFSLKLQKQLTMSKWAEANKLSMYELTGSETLGSIIRVQPRSGEALELSRCSIQWYRLSSESNRREFISGANKSSYAPEPFDVGRILQVDITSNGHKAAVTTAGPVDPAAGVGTYVETLSRKSNTEFSVVISQMNGRNYSSHSVHLFHVGKMRVKLCRGWITKARDSYSTSMQLCGFRGGGNLAAKSLFWQARKGQSFVLVFDSERDRNAAIVLARRYALDCNVVLTGPDDIASLYI
ncbi:stomatal closure-related actin-binding protein 3 isoform X2 [Daucus carota subsp. sativus]|uniref:stomatal closure-related actin-binding protein 3 isoform X2 n=1 Tax=Daucus carota subsp. sativus TaxID=79200 RepID=UPI0007F03B68|nr:PREDICTED: stomatal closure-related actin-binding protein 3-like isoform X2 [Daucus carota subsp. sativus]